MSTKFEKVSFEEYEESLRNLFPQYEWTNGELNKIYNNIVLPERATKQAPGYDFFTPFEFTLRPGTGIIIPTGVKCMIDDYWALMIVPTKSNGFSSVRLSNTIGFINADSYHKDGSTQIYVKLEIPYETPYPLKTSKFRNDLTIYRNAMTFMTNAKICQGIFIPFGVTVDDNQINVNNEEVEK